jgi:hypothetical protein
MPAQLQWHRRHPRPVDELVHIAAANGRQGRLETGHPMESVQAPDRRGRVRSRQAQLECGPIGLTLDALDLFRLTVPVRRNIGEILLSTETEARLSCVPQPVLLEDDFVRKQERSSAVVKLNQVHPPAKVVDFT